VNREGAVLLLKLNMIITLRHLQSPKLLKSTTCANIVDDGLRQRGLKLGFGAGDSVECSSRARTVGQPQISDSSG
jgi:hypothetical protein